VAGDRGGVSRGDLVTGYGALMGWGYVERYRMRPFKAAREWKEQEG
jgi:hypothetical protein